MGKLTAKSAQAAKQPGMLADGGGLYLRVRSPGNRAWVFRYQLGGKRQTLALGSLRDLTLAQARDAAAECRRNLAAGRPPRAREPAPEPTPTFTTCAARYIRAHRRGWRNAKHARQWVSTLKRYARAQIGGKPVDAITTDDILTVLNPIWIAKNETAKRVQGRVENILDFGAARQWRDPVNPARWRGHLDKLLPKPSRVQRVRHHPAMPYVDLPAFWAELAGLGSVSASALKFLILTACRTGEVIGAQWAEIDLEAAVWTVPAERMKARREHRVPLSAPAVAVLEALPRRAGNPFVFPGARHGRPLSNMAMLQLMRGMGYGVDGDRGDYVPHGFRSSFRDWSGEVSSFPRDVAEMALAHVIENKVEAAYRRGDLFAKRRRLMDAWAGWCCTAPAEAASLKVLQA